MKINKLAINNFKFLGVNNKRKKLREDCRSLHTEPLHQGAELPRQAVVQKGLSTFRNSFTISSLADRTLKIICQNKETKDIDNEIVIVRGIKK